MGMDLFLSGYHGRYHFHRSADESVEKRSKAMHLPDVRHLFLERFVPVVEIVLQLIFC